MWLEIFGCGYLSNFIENPGLLTQSEFRRLADPVLTLIEVDTLFHVTLNVQRPVDLIATDQRIWNKDIASYVRFGAYGIVLVFSNFRQGQVKYDFE